MGISTLKPLAIREQNTNQNNKYFGSNRSTLETANVTELNYRFE